MTDRAFDFGMTEQNLNSSQIAGCLIDYRRLRSPQRMSSVFLRLKANAGDPLPDETGILPCDYMAHIVVSRWKNEVIEGAASPLEPSEQRLTGGLYELELHWPLGLLLYDHGTISDTAASGDVADAYLDYVAAP
jgi:hypothetical protein